MGRQYSREELLGRLCRCVEMRQPILGAGCSCGLVARCAELSGADLAMIYSTGKSRLMGLPTTRLGDSNTITLALLDEIWNVTSAIPLIAGVDAADPFRLDLKRLLAKFVEAGCSGVINFPNIVGLGDYYRRRRDKVGLGFDREVALVREARAMDLFTMAYIYSKHDVAPFVAAGVDCVVAHVGPTEGGLQGVPYDGTVDSALGQAKDILAAAAAADPKLIRLAHGGPFAEPEDTSALYEKTQAMGFVGASSIERIPVERAVMDVVARFKQVPVGRREHE